MKVIYKQKKQVYTMFASVAIAEKTLRVDKQPKYILIGRVFLSNEIRMIPQQLFNQNMSTHMTKMISRVYNFYYKLLKRELLGPPVNTM